MDQGIHRNSSAPRSQNKEISYFLETPKSVRFAHVSFGEVYDDEDIEKVPRDDVQQRNVSFSSGTPDAFNVHNYNLNSSWDNSIRLSADHTSRSIGNYGNSSIDTIENTTDTSPSIEAGKDSRSIRKEFVAKETNFSSENAAVSPNTLQSADATHCDQWSSQNVAPVKGNCSVKVEGQIYSIPLKPCLPQSQNSQAEEDYHSVSSQTSCEEFQPMKNLPRVCFDPLFLVGSAGDGKKPQDVESNLSLDDHRRAKTRNPGKAKRSSTPFSKYSHIDISDSDSDSPDAVAQSDCTFPAFLHGTRTKSPSGHTDFATRKVPSRRDEGTDVQSPVNTRGRSTFCRRSSRDRSLTPFARETPDIYDEETDDVEQIVKSESSDQKVDEVSNELAISSHRSTTKRTSRGQTMGPEGNSIKRKLTPFYRSRTHSTADEGTDENSCESVEAEAGAVSPLGNLRARGVAANFSGQPEGFDTKFHEPLRGELGLGGDNKLKFQGKPGISMSTTASLSTPTGRGGSGIVKDTAKDSKKNNAPITNRSLRFQPSSKLGDEDNGAPRRMLPTNDEVDSVPKEKITGRSSSTSHISDRNEESSKVDFAVESGTIAGGLHQNSRGRTMTTKKMVKRSQTPFTDRRAGRPLEKNKVKEVTRSPRAQRSVAASNRAIASKNSPKANRKGSIEAPANLVRIPISPNVNRKEKFDATWTKNFETGNPTVLPLQSRVYANGHASERRHPKKLIDAGTQTDGTTRTLRLSGRATNHKGICPTCCQAMPSSAGESLHDL